MFCYNGKELLEFFDTLEAIPPRERSIMSTLLYCINGVTQDRVIVLYGLRRTGKSTLMRQAIVNHLDANDACYIVCNSSNTMKELYARIQECKSKYIFIDEVTKIKDFIDNSSSLADIFAVSGKKIVLTGTDSLGFKTTRGSELYDRMYMIHTTYISYTEFAYLTGKDIFDYMQYGGTLGIANPFESKETLDEYTNSAIIDNLLHTYSLWEEGEHEDRLLHGLSKEEIRSLVTYYIRKENTKFLSSELKKFKASEFHVPGKFIKRDSESTIDTDVLLKNDKLTDAWQKQLGILSEYTTQVTDAVLQSIAVNLIDLDVLTPLKTYDEVNFNFTQPGMRYCHIEQALNLLQKNTDILQEYTRAEVNYVMELFKNNIEGHLLENIIKVDLHKKYQFNSDIEISSFRTSDAEYGIVLTNVKTKKALIYEVKRSNQIVSNQKRWLIDKELEDTFIASTGLSVVGKAVLYTGETTTDTEGMSYLNIGEFLQKADTLTSQVTDIIDNVKLTMKICDFLLKAKINDTTAWLSNHTTSEKLAVLGYNYFAV